MLVFAHGIDFAYHLVEGLIARWIYRHSTNTRRYALLGIRGDVGPPAAVARRIVRMAHPIAGFPFPICEEVLCFRTENVIIVAAVTKTARATGVEATSTLRNWLSVRIALIVGTWRAMRHPVHGYTNT